MDHITRASKNLTDAQFKTTLDPFTWTGTSFIVEPTGRPVIQEKTPPPEVGSSPSKLGKGGARRERSTSRGAGRNLEKFSRVGGHLHATTVKSNTQRKRLPQNAGPRQSKVVQGEAERLGEKQPALLEGKIVAGRVRVEDAVDSRAIKTTVQALKDKGSVCSIKTPEQDPGNQAATHRPPIKGNLIDGGNARISIHDNLHNNTEGSRTKDEQRTPRPKDDNRITAHRQDVPGTRPLEGQHVPQGPQDQDADSLSNLNSAGALSLEPTSSPAQVRQPGEEPAPFK